MSNDKVDPITHDVEPEEDHDVPFSMLRSFLWNIGKCWHLWSEWEVERDGDVMGSEGSKIPIGRYIDQKRECQICKFKEYNRRKWFT